MRKINLIPLPDFHGLRPWMNGGAGRRPVWAPGFFLIVAISICALSCSNPPATSPVVSETNTGYTANIKAGEFAPGELEAHYLKHGAEFGDITKEQYLENARTLLNATPGEDLLEKTRSNGDVLHYRISTAEFAVMTLKGRIRTYFKADDKYWMRQ